MFEALDVNQQRYMTVHAVSEVNKFSSRFIILCEIVYNKRDGGEFVTWACSGEEARNLLLGPQHVLPARDWGNYFTYSSPGTGTRTEVYVAAVK